MTPDNPGGSSHWVSCGPLRSSIGLARAQRAEREAADAAMRPRLL
jgi:hypothetical protein